MFHEEVPRHNIINSGREDANHIPTLSLPGATIHIKETMDGGLVFPGSVSIGEEQLVLEILQDSIANSQDHPEQRRFPVRTVHAEVLVG